MRRGWVRVARLPAVPVAHGLNLEIFSNPREMGTHPHLLAPGDRSCRWWGRGCGFHLPSPLDASALQKLPDGNFWRSLARSWRVQSFQRSLEKVLTRLSGNCHQRGAARRTLRAAPLATFGLGRWKPHPHPHRLQLRSPCASRWGMSSFPACGKESQIRGLCHSMAQQ